ncbi:MAG TPA: PaaI family thioesterase, partial [Stellaceae bacterium]|nr:PaaI family thioesterase [Stellaceae bacterium]
RLPYHSDFLRPGGTIGGPLQMALADLAMYAAVMAAAGPVEAAVTTNLTMNFLRKPGPADLLAHARLLKLGKRLAVGEVELYSEGEPDMVAHATVTYSIPPR